MELFTKLVYHELFRDMKFIRDILGKKIFANLNKYVYLGNIHTVLKKIKQHLIKVLIKMTNV